MSDYITLTCPSCGGQLQITRDLDRFACGNCGNELIVKRGGGTISLAPVVEGLKEVKTGVDKTASELAIVRLKAEIEYLYKQRDIGRPNKEKIYIFCFFGLLLMFFLYIIGVSIIVILICFIIPAIIGLWYFRKKIKEYQKNKVYTETLITQKKDELKYHQGIVNGKPNLV
jgi:hypothetical protein